MQTLVEEIVVIGSCRCAARLLVGAPGFVVVSTRDSNLVNQSPKKCLGFDES
jgi:hypothetical protein